jgi:hypothetical protein
MGPKPFRSENPNQIMTVALQRATNPQRAPVSAAGKHSTYLAGNQQTWPTTYWLNGYKKQTQVSPTIS